MRTENKILCIFNKYLSFNIKIFSTVTSIMMFLVNFREHPVSLVVCRELGNNHSSFQSENVRQAENQWVFLE